MQPFCFDFGDRYFDFGQWRLAFRVYTELNAYTPAPGRGSTGVYESGFGVPFVPDPQHDIIPAIAFVEDTLDDHKDYIDEVIEVARRYGRRKGIL